MDCTPPLQMALGHSDFDTARLLAAAGATWRRADLDHVESGWHRRQAKLALELGGLCRLFGRSADDPTPLSEWHDATGITPLHVAAHKGYIHAVRHLLLLPHGGGGDVAVRDAMGMDALQYAAMGGHAEVSRTLLQRRADVNRTRADGTTAMMVAARRGDVRLTQVLWEHGGRVNTSDEDGYTPLHFYATAGNLALCKELVKKGADVNIENASVW